MTLIPWASIKGGKWHKIKTMPNNFREIVHSQCGLHFEPYNVAEGQPNYICESGLCRLCLTRDERGQA